MEKTYFTALITASNLDIKFKKIQMKSSLKITLPPMIPLEFYKTPQVKEKYIRKINTIKEFKTDIIIKKDDWWVVSLQENDLETLFKHPNSNLFPKKEYNILLGQDKNNEWNPPVLHEEIIRNWELGFFELIDNDPTQPLNNFELILRWKIKKRRLKG